MNTINFLIAHFNNFKKNPFILSKKNKINNLKIDVIINNIVKAKENDDFDFLDGESNPKRGTKRSRKFYNKKDDNKNGKIRVTKLNKYYEKK